MTAAVVSGVALATPTAALAMPTDSPFVRETGGHSAAQRSARAILTELAGQVSHGWRDDRVPLATLEQRLVAGKRLAVTCGVVTLLAQRALARAGIESRVVVTMTRAPYGDDNGHTMLEVRTAGGWEVWDLDNNRRAVDEDGRGVPIAQLVNAGRARHWERIARDPALNLAGASPELKAAAKRVQADLAAWYDHAFGVPLIQTADGYAFTDETDRARLEAYSPAYHWVTPEQWEKIQNAAHAPPGTLEVSDPMVPARVAGLRARPRPLSVRYRLSFATTVRMTVDRRACARCRWRPIVGRTQARPAGLNERQVVPRRLRPLRPGTYRIGVKPAWALPTFTTVTVR